MNRRTRFIAALAGMATLLFGLDACVAAPPPHAWVLDPIRYDNRMDGTFEVPRFIDTPYPMAVTSDTAGGFWGVSSGSWLHIDATGRVARRFNLEHDAPRSVGVALSPTELIVVSGEGSAGDPHSIQLFDTEAMSWEELYRDGRLLGAMAATGSDLYFVVYAFDEPTFTIERLALTPGAQPVAVAPKLDGFGPVGLAVDQGGTLYVATTTEHIVMAADGSIRSREAIRSDYPAVAVNARGDVAWSMGFVGNRDVATDVAGGSTEARRIIDEHLRCDSGGALAPAGVRDWLVVGVGQGPEMPLFCSPSGFTWIDDRQLVVSVGNEGGAPLVRVTLPESLWG